MLLRKSSYPPEKIVGSASADGLSADGERNPSAEADPTTGTCSAPWSAAQRSAKSASSLSNEPVHPAVIPARSLTNAAISSGVAAPYGSHVTVTRVRPGSSSAKVTVVSIVSGQSGAP